MTTVLIRALSAFACIAAAGMPLTAATRASQVWEIGPIIKGRNYSVGMPLHPIPAGHGWRFDFPYPSAEAGHVHYVTFNPGSLAGKSRIVVRYRVDAARGVRFVPQETPGEPATVSLFLQRRGDTWTAKRQYAWYRWYAPPVGIRQIAPGEHEMTVRLGDNWTSVLGKPAQNNPAAFTAALADAGRIGLVFGSSRARGHGVFATGPARFTLISFRVL